MHKRYASEHWTKVNPSSRLRWPKTTKRTVQCFRCRSLLYSTPTSKRCTKISSTARNSKTRGSDQIHPLYHTERLMAVFDTSSLLIVEINVNSLISLVHRKNLISFLNAHRQHIVLLVETVLLSKHTMHFPNYTYIRSDKNSFRNGRGNGILIRNNIKFEQVNTQAWNLQSLETTSILIESEDNQKLLLIAAYRPHSNTIDTNDFVIISNYRNNVSRCKMILGGDLNAHHEDWWNARRCTNCINWINLNGTLQNLTLVFSAKPTFYRTNYSSHLDLFLLNEDLTIKLALDTRLSLRPSSDSNRNCA